MHLPEQMREAILAHARWAFPEEACGLLARDGSGRWRMVYCLTNADRSPRSFTVDPVEQYRAMQHAERHGWEIAGSFHSHPVGSAVPSATDVARALDPTWMYLVAGPVSGRAAIRAYRIRAGDFTEEAIAWVGDAGGP